MYTKNKVIVAPLTSWEVQFNSGEAEGFGEFSNPLVA